MSAPPIKVEHEKPLTDVEQRYIEALRQSREAEWRAQSAGSALCDAYEDEEERGRAFLRCMRASQSEGASS